MKEGQVEGVQAETPAEGIESVLNGDAANGNGNEASGQESSGEASQAQPEGDGKAGNDGASKAEPEAGKEFGGKEGESGAAAKKEGQDKAWQEFSASMAEASGADKDLLESFAKSASELGLSVEQAQGVAKWQLAAIKQAGERMKAEGYKALKEKWGEATDANLNEALKVATMLDKRMDGAFSASLARFGVANDAAFVEGMHHLALLLGEDTVGSTLSTPAAEKEETPLQALQGIFGKG